MQRLVTKSNIKFINCEKMYIPCTLIQITALQNVGNLVYSTLAVSFEGDIKKVLVHSIWCIYLCQEEIKYPTQRVNN